MSYNSQIGWLPKTNWCYWHVSKVILYYLINGSFPKVISNCRIIKCQILFKYSGICLTYFVIYCFVIYFNIYVFRERGRSTTRENRDTRTLHKTLSKPPSSEKGGRVPFMRMCVRICVCTIFKAVIHITARRADDVPDDSLPTYCGADTATDARDAEDHKIIKIVFFFV